MLSVCRAGPSPPATGSAIRPAAPAGRPRPSRRFQKMPLKTFYTGAPG